MFSILGTPIKTPSGVFAIRKTAPVQTRLDMPPKAEWQPPTLGEIMKHKTPKADPLRETLAALKAKASSRKAVQVAPPPGGKGRPVEDSATAKPSADDLIATLTQRVNSLQAEVLALRGELSQRQLIPAQKAFTASALGCSRR